MAENKQGRLVQAVIVFLVFTFIAAVGFVSWYLRPPYDLEVVLHHPQLSGKTLNLTGKVFRRHLPVANAKVSIVTAGARGERIDSRVVTTNKDGGFSVTRMAHRQGKVVVREIMVYAAAENPDSRPDPRTGKKDMFYGSHDIVISEDGQTVNRVLRLWVVWLLFLPAVYMANLMLGFGRFSGRARYIGSVALACLFAFTMFLAVAWGISAIGERARSGDVLEMGVGYVAYGSYVPQASPSWHFVADTARPDMSVAPKPNEASLNGFGAPLWVIQFAVMGSAFMLITVLIKEIASGTTTLIEQHTLDTRLEKIFIHQLFVLFSPLGAIFVYQALVVTGTANAPLTVAVAALGAGASANVLLQRAAERARELMMGQNNAGPVSTSTSQVGKAQIEKLKDSDVPTQLPT